VRQDAEQVAPVALGLELIQACRRRGEEVAGGLRVVVGADEEPGLPADGNAAELASAGAIGRLEVAIVGVAHELDLRGVDAPALAMKMRRRISSTSSHGRS
jgi:hypothetical protein